MATVLRGYCPECGCAVLAAGALVYDDTGERVIACDCGSRAAPSPLPPIRKSKAA